MKTVKEVSILSGVSVRTLHHYDKIGLFPPTALSEAGYRLYDDEALIRLQKFCYFVSWNSLSKISNTCLSKQKRKGKTY